MNLFLKKFHQKKRSPQMSQKKGHFQEPHVFFATFFFGGEKFITSDVILNVMYK